MDNISTHLKFGSNCQVGNRIYFFNITFNGIYYLDITDLSIHFVHKFSVGRANEAGLSINKALVHGEAIYFFPNKTNVVMMYDIAEQREHIIPILGYDGKFFRTSGVIQQGDLVYIFPVKLNKGVYVLDLQRQRVEKDRELSLLFEAGFDCKSSFLSHDDYVLLAMYGGNAFVEVNLKTKQIVASGSLDEGIQIHSIYFDGSRYWIIQTKSTDIYEWDRENDILQTYINEQEVWEDLVSVPYSNMIFLEDEILVLNYCLKNILRIDREKKTVGNPIVFPHKFRMVNNRYLGFPVYRHYTVIGNKVLLYPCRGNMLLIYDKTVRQIWGKEVIVTAEEDSCLKEVLTETFSGDELCVENDDLETLLGFLNIIETNKSVSQLSDRKGTGKLIWQEC